MAESLVKTQTPKPQSPDQQLATLKKFYPAFDPALIAHVNAVTEFARPHGGKDFPTVMAWSMLESFGNPKSSTSSKMHKQNAFGAFHFKPETLLDGFLKTADLQVKFNPSLQGYVDQAKALLKIKAKNPSQYTAGAVQFAENLFKDPMLTAQVQALIVAKSGDYVSHFLGDTGAKNLREAAAGKNNITIGNVLENDAGFPQKDLPKHLTAETNPFISPNMEYAVKGNASFFFTCKNGQCKAKLPSETLREIDRRVEEKTALFNKDYPDLRLANLNAPPTQAAPIKDTRVMAQADTAAKIPPPVKQAKKATP